MPLTWREETRKIKLGLLAVGNPNYHGPGPCDGHPCPWRETRSKDKDVRRTETVRFCLNEIRSLF